MLIKNLSSIIVFLPILTGCLSPCPEYIDNGIYISHWDSKSPPESIELYRYKKDSNFQVPLEKLVPTNVIINQGKDLASLALDFDKIGDFDNLTVDHDGFDRFSLKYDYKLVLNNKKYFNISHLKAGNNGSLGCPLESASINQCGVLFSHGGLFFENSCAAMVK